MSDLARNALGSLLTGCGDPLSLAPNLLPTRAARGILGVLVRLGPGQSAEVIRDALAGEVDGADLEAELEACYGAEVCFTPEAFNATVRALERERRQQRLKALAGQIVTRIDEGDTPEMLAHVAQELKDLTAPRVGDDVEPIGANVHELFTGSDSVSVPFGLEALAPLRVCPGELCVVASRPGVGKSAMLGNVALAAARADWRVLLLSLEMPAKQLRQRFLSALSGIPLERVMRPQGTELLPHIERMAKLPIGIRDAVGGEVLTVEGVGSSVHAYRRKEPDRNMVVLVDYLQLIRTRDRYERRHELIGHVCRELKAVSLRSNVPVIAAAQLGRMVEQRGKEAEPVMSDLAESGDIEKNADQILFLHRKFGEADTTLKVAKYRMGETFSAHADFDGPHCVFVDRPGITRDEWQ
jgi:replicative DNA helicase